MYNYSDADAEILELLSAVHTFWVFCVRIVVRFFFKSWLYTHDWKHNVQSG
jgi:hypothetical protein